MKSIICWLKNLWINLEHFDSPFPFNAGHEWVEQEVHKNCTVHIDKCERCGKVNISWENNNLYEQNTTNN